MGYINAIIKAPADEVGYMTKVNNELESFQYLVKGYIETLTLKADPEDEKSIVVICNEEGWLQDMPYNCTVGGFELAGTILVVGVDGDEFADVPISLDEWKEEWL